MLIAPILPVLGETKEEQKAVEPLDDISWSWQCSNCGHRNTSFHNFFLMR